VDRHTRTEPRHRDRRAPAPRSRLRPSGLGVVGDVPWGAHLCHFYETRRDLLEFLIPFFKAGLDHGEFCLWVVSEPLTGRDARHAMRKAVPGFERHLSEGRMEILPHETWYLGGKGLDLKRTMRRWHQKLDQALARGYPGMRATANVAWLKARDWAKFSSYERAFDASLANRPMIVLCTYPLASSAADHILNVVRTHKSTVAVRHGRWEVLESSELKRTKDEIERLKTVLEQRVVERTSQLKKANVSLTQEIAERTRAEGERAILFDQVSASREQLQLLSRRLLQLQETERRAIARELHDEIGQMLTALRLLLTIKPGLPQGKALSRVTDARSVVQNLFERVRALALDLRPAMLDELGLVGSLLGLFRRYTKRTNIRIRFDHHGLEAKRFPPEVETAAFRIVQEALTNVARHSGVSSATVSLQADSRILSVRIEDSGRGFAPVEGRADSSTGLIGMQERARLLGGILTVDSAPSEGTRVTAALPVGSDPRRKDRPRRSGRGLRARSPRARTHPPARV
jgi:signal transduction histidine kinase